jgi:probable F420-dependent oxidoreductase
MKYWLNVGFLELHQLVAVAQAAERLGFEGVTLPDHLFFPEQIRSRYPYSSSGEVGWSLDAPWPDCWVSVAAMAQATTRLRFTTSVYIAPLRDVFTLAKAAGTAAILAGGRMSCGFGAGWLREEFDAVGQDFDSRGPRFDEVLKVLRLLWSGEMVEFHGDHVSFDAVCMRPATPGIAILVGGNTKPALRRAAGSDGWIGTYTELGDVTRMLDELADLRARVDRSDEPFELLISANPGASRDATALDHLGVQGMIIPAVALATTTTTTTTSTTGEVIAGLERFAERRMS